MKDLEINIGVDFEDRGYLYHSAKVRSNWEKLFLMRSLPCCCKSRGRPRSKASKGEAVVFYCESLATKEMGHHRLSLRVKNMTNFLFVLEVTKSLFANHA
ncbi:MAG: hypothetical protein A2V65_07125 [Deltaproteobacteria bacterium RBG_13_49_15]|nr:MAG: hypothetical protein A2V65_07125 [Deltaproteobacteria bacterium RBG_13_49_15]